MTDIPATPAQTLTRARRIALDAGLHYVYTGNEHDLEGDATACPHCGHKVIERDWYDILRYDLDDAGRCIRCGAQVPGRFGHFEQAFGSRRIPVVLHAA